MTEGRVVAEELKQRLQRAGLEAGVASGAPDGYDVAGPMPVCTVAPNDEGAVAALLEEASRSGWAVVVRGAGTQDRAGSPLGRAPVVVLDTRRLRGLIAHTPGDLTARVRAGTSLEELNAALAPHGQHLPLEPPGGQGASLGGVVAGDAWGPERVLWGGPRDLVLGLRAVDGRGTRFATGGQVVKNVSGLDVGKLLIGSFGTLAVLTEINVRLRPLAPAHASWAVQGPAARLWEVAARIREGKLAPLGLAVDGAGDRARLTVALEGGRAEVAAQLRELSALEPGALEPEAAQAAWAAAHEPGAAGLWALVRCEVPEGALGDIWGAARRMSGVLRVLAWPGFGVLWCALGPAAGIGGVQQLRALAVEAGGLAVVPAGPREPVPDLYPFGEPGALLPLLTAIRQRFDPQAVLGPGRMWPI